MTVVSVAYELEFPVYLDGYELETEAKGYLVDLVVRSGPRQWNLTVYDPTRLSQEVVDELRASGHLALANLLVVPQVTRSAITTALDHLATTNFTNLTTDQEMHVGVPVAPGPFDDILDALRTRPGMYLPDARFNTLVAFLEGYNISADGRLLAGFTDWVHDRALGYLTNFHWRAIIASIVLGEGPTEQWQESVTEDFDSTASTELLSQLSTFHGPHEMQ